VWRAAAGPGAGMVFSGRPPKGANGDGYPDRKRTLCPVFLRPAGTWNGTSRRDYLVSQQCPAIDAPSCDPVTGHDRPSTPARPGSGNPARGGPLLGDGVGSEPAERTPRLKLCVCRGAMQPISGPAGGRATCVCVHKSQAQCNPFGPAWGWRRGCVPPPTPRGRVAHTSSRAAQGHAG
jgi:hypothetical protein